jgi:hypothetical protein
MSKIAVDAVLLPSDEVAAMAIKANRRLQKQCPGRIVLDKTTCLPHISLAMGCINIGDIDVIGPILCELAERHGPKTLISADIHVGTNSAGERVSALKLEKTETLQTLHEEVMRSFEPYFRHDVTAEMVYSRQACESTLRWIREFPEKASFDNFFPHITLGYGQLCDFAFPERFTAERIALCHLGNHCTCRKILASAELPL